ncbi:MAG: PDZ domain-containing protein, partial [Bacteroidetes bacterium]|nr:PDZ domain-containing protein [Bacteroidota bacterium]
DGSPAEKAGIEDGDVLVAFNNVAIGEPKDLTGALKKLKEGDKATVTVERDGARKTFDVVLGAAKERKAIVRKSIRVPRSPRALRAPLGRIMPSLGGIMPSLRWIMGSSGTYGLKLETLDRQLGEYFGAKEGEGVLVKSVKEDSDGAKAGFKAGDVIVRAGKKTVEDVDDFRSVLGAYDAGEKIPVKIIRKGKEATIELTAKEEEEDGEHRIIMKNFGGGVSPRMFHFYSDEDMDEFDGLESDDFDIRFDVDADEFEDEVRQMRIMINGKELRLDELKEHMEELKEHMDELRENIEVEVDDGKVEIRTKKI